MRQVIHPPDPRIHFALVCGAKSCPPIKVTLCADSHFLALPHGDALHMQAGKCARRRAETLQEKRTLACGQVYTAEALEEGLHSAALAFVQSEVEDRAKQRELLLSRIFQWYGPDFGSRADLLAFLLKHLAEPQKSALRALLDGEHDIAFKFRPYDWSLNAA